MHDATFAENLRSMCVGGEVGTSMPSYLISVHGHHFCIKHHTLASSVRLSCFHIANSVLIWKDKL